MKKNLLISALSFLFCAELALAEPLPPPVTSGSEQGVESLLESESQKEPEPSLEQAEAPPTEPAELSPTGPESAEENQQEAEPIRYPRIHSSGQIQFQLDDGELGSPRASSPFPSSSGLGPYPADTHLFIRRFRPAFDIEFNPDLTLQTEFNIDSVNQKIQVLDIRFDQNLSEETYLSVGRFKVPFGFEGSRSSRATNTIERSDMTVSLYPERDVGVSLNHETDLGEFSLGSFLGQPRGNGGSNGHLDLIGRGVFNLHDGVKLGLSGHVGSFRPTGTGLDIPVRRVGTELHVNQGPITLEAEAMWSDGYNVTSRADTRAFGYYAAAVTKLGGPWDFVLHYDRFDPDRDGIDNLVARNEVNARDRKVIGVNYYIDRELGHRIMLNYEWRQTLEGPSLHTDGWRLRYQFAW